MLRLYTSLGILRLSRAQVLLEIKVIFVVRRGFDILGLSVLLEESVGLSAEGGLEHSKLVLGLLHINMVIRMIHLVGGILARDVNGGVALDVAVAV